MSIHPNLITILGPTAVGKTALAACLADAIGGEIISADSRQVFRGMDIGTGKDLTEYFVHGKEIPFHLIDIAEPGTEFSLYNFRKEFETAHRGILNRGKTPVLCGGTGLYLDSVLRGYNVPYVPENPALHEELEQKGKDELIRLLASVSGLHNTTDTEDKARLIRAIEIGKYKKDAGNMLTDDFTGTPVFGLRYSRSEIRARITLRLKDRMRTGLIEEVQRLIRSGIATDRLKLYGLEYRFVTMYLLGELEYSDMLRFLNTAIHQFAKRQMTWFRRMERNGVPVFWLEGVDGYEKNLGRMLQVIENYRNESK